jgi:hypothetical protein
VECTGFSAENPDFAHEGKIRAHCLGISLGSVGVRCHQDQGVYTLHNVEDPFGRKIFHAGECLRIGVEPNGGEAFL